MQGSRIIFPGAGFGVLELSTLESEAPGDVAGLLSGPRPTSAFQKPYNALLPA
jgi:hypothetical protein